MPKDNLYQNPDKTPVSTYDEFKSYVLSIGDKYREQYYEDYRHHADISDIKMDSFALEDAFNQFFPNCGDEEKKLFNNKYGVLKTRGGRFQQEKVLLTRDSVYAKIFSMKDVFDRIEQKYPNPEDREKIAQRAIEAASTRYLTELSKSDRSLKAKNKEALQNNKIISSNKNRLQHEKNARHAGNIVNAETHSVVIPDFKDLSFDDAVREYNSTQASIDNASKNWQKVYYSASMLQRMDELHRSRSFFSKFFHPFRNAKENRMISDLKQKLRDSGVSNENINSLTGENSKFETDKWKDISAIASNEASVAQIYSNKYAANTINENEEEYNIDNEPKVNVDLNKINEEEVEPMNIDLNESQEVSDMNALQNQSNEETLENSQQV